MGGKVGLLFLSECQPELSPSRERVRSKGACGISSTPLRTCLESAWEPRVHLFMLPLAFYEALMGNILN